MARNSLLLAVSLAFGLQGLACPALPQTADEAELRSANAAEVTAFLTDNTPALETLWADSFVVTNPQATS